MSDIITKASLAETHPFAYAYSYNTSVRDNPANRVAVIAAMRDYSNWPQKMDANLVFDPVGSISYTRGRQKFNFCDHTHKRMEYGPAYDKTYGIAKSNGYWIYAYAYRGTKNRHPSTVLTNPEITDQLRARAWSELLPQLNDGLSMLNFILELADFRQLITTASKLRCRIALLKVRDIDLPQTAADLALAYAFGLAPMYDDLKRLANSLFNVNKIVDEFIEAGKKAETYHYTEELWNDKVREAVTTTGHWEEYSSCIYHATLRCTYAYKKPPFLEALTRVMGLDLTLERLWNAIPWTFVVDWVYKVADALAALERDPNLTVNVIDYCDSIKESNRVDHYLSDRGSTWLNLLSSNPSMQFEWVEPTNEITFTEYYERYRRFPALPNTGYALPVSDALSARELVLGGALLRASIL